LHPPSSIYQHINIIAMRIIIVILIMMMKGVMHICVVHHLMMILTQEVEVQT
jgi:hypothetical protein